MTQLNVVASGGVTSPQGFLAGAAFAGIRADPSRPDLALLYSQAPCTAAGVFTTNLAKAAPVIVSQEHLADGRAQAVIANAGCANACTGQQGMADAREMAALAAAKLGLSPQDVVVASTGVIGRLLPMDRVRTAVSGLMLSFEGGASFARAITTTDTRPKERAVSFQWGRRRYTVGGCAKGAGMIHPNMATMLSFITTDAPVGQKFLAECLREAVATSFNAIDIDGDTSTNDTLVVLANGRASGEPLERDNATADLFRQALTDVCTHLARAIAADGEGATRLIQVTVEGAPSNAEARQAARHVAGSLLVKTAVYGGDLNWGRILAALGASGVYMEEGRTVLYLGDVCLYRHGSPTDYDEATARKLLLGPEVPVRINMGLGEGKGTAWGCDLTEDYVRLNSQYTT